MAFVKQSMMPKGAQPWMFAVGLLLATASTARAQITGGVMAVTQSHMS